MRRQVGGHVDDVAIGMLDADSARVEVHLAADGAGQKARLAPIFAVADDRVPDCGHMDAQLVRAASEGLQLDPCRDIARALHDAVAGARRATFLFVDVHFFAASAGLLGNRQLDHAVMDVGDTDDDCPVYFARGAAGESGGEVGCGARGAGDQQGARRILVEPVHQLGPPLALISQRIEQAVDMIDGAATALCRQPGRLVEHEARIVLVDDKALRKRDFVIGQVGNGALGPLRCDFCHARFGRRHADDLPRDDAIPWRRARAVNAQLPRPCPARDDVETGIGQMPLEPAVKPDPVIIGGHRELSDGIGHR